MRITEVLGKCVAGLAAVAVFSVPAVAQDDDEGPITQGEDARYLSITHVDFKPGQRESAMDLITEYFVKASQKAGTPGPILAIHYQTGKWDASFIWELPGGMADLEWYRSPRDIKWFAALSEIVGGEDKASEIWADFNSKIASSVTEVGHHHVPVAE
jgi:hypothetical protein